MVTPYRDDYYADTGIYPKNVLLMIEVTDSSLEKDINITLPIYAKAGIPEVWIIDVNRELIFQYASLQNKEYQQQHSISRDKQFTASTLRLEVKAKDLIG